MRRLLILLLCAGSAVCYGQRDSSRTTAAPTPTQVPVPGIDAPLSGPGTLLQSTPNPNAAAPLPNRRRDRRSRRTNPPSDPRAFGVAIPLEKPRPDTTRQQR